MLSIYTCDVDAVAVMSNFALATTKVGKNRLRIYNKDINDDWSEWKKEVYN